MKYEIFQVNDQYRHDVGFERYNFVKKYVGEPRRDWYDLVYEFDGEGFELDDIFEKFNIDRPDDFKGHSMSVSDVVGIDGRYYYCDSWTWVPLVEGF